MNHTPRDYYPGKWSGSESATPTTKRRSIGFWLAVICVVAAVSVLLTYTLTNAANRQYYSEKLEIQQQAINHLKQEQGKTYSDEFETLEVLAAIFERYSYYSEDMDEETLLNAVLKAYAKATGDLYAEYYTEEEYQQMTAENGGDFEGIGISTLQTTVTVDGYEYLAFQIISVFENGPAFNAGLRADDLIYAVLSEGNYQTVRALGYSKALSLLRGARGTQAEFLVFRKSGETYQTLEFNITRDVYESESVQYRTVETNPEIGIVRIDQFDLTTPQQFKHAITALRASGVQKFIFDVRNNPGGDLQSIKAVLTYFLQKGDVILSAIDADGVTVKSYFAEPTMLTGDYASCSVAASEIGMYADLEAVVICNGNTASAAEVFTATLRDYGKARIVGEKTFGKGIMQSFLPLSMFGNYSGYVKMTTYAYVTKCGVTYHEIGISPDEGCEVALSDAAKEYHFYVLPQALDDQLQVAIQQFQ